MEVTRGNGYAPAWGSLVMMMMMINSALTGSAWLQLSHSLVALQCGVSDQQVASSTTGRALLGTWVSRWMGDCLWMGKCKSSRYISLVSHLGQLSLPSHRDRSAKSSAGLSGWG